MIRDNENRSLPKRQCQLPKRPRREAPCVNNTHIRKCFWQGLAGREGADCATVLEECVSLRTGAVPSLSLMPIFKADMQITTLKLGIVEKGMVAQKAVVGLGVACKHIIGCYSEIQILASIQ